MSFALDVNVLLYASDSESPLHGRARRFLEDCAGHREVFYIAWPTLMSYLRIATHPAIFAHPLSAEQAMANVDALVALPHVRLLSEQQSFWEVYRETAKAVPARGNLVPDAHLAALLRQNGVRVLYTLDKDFLKFRFLDVRNPFS